MSTEPSLVSHKRLVHLDFHTSPYIPDVASEFDAREFARTFKRAHVNAVTVFAKCHHGMSYYPTTVGTQHPALAGRDLLGEQIEALHREGICCPIYTTVAWEEDAAQRRPEWRQMTKGGLFCGSVADPQHPHPGAWKFLNFLHPDYLDYIEAHVRELLARYDVDGLFFDIVFFDPSACWSESSIRFREAHGFMDDDPSTQRRFESAAQEAFARRFTALLHGARPQASIFYNQTNFTSIDSQVGIRKLAEEMTHFEVESLPSGFWGYHHFPKLARQVSSWQKPWIGQTGRFQRMWGDFGGIKPQAALEYECFRTQMLGGNLGIGDQLPPRGTLDAAAYALIGSVYEQCEAAEPFYAGSTPLPQVGILLASHPGNDYLEASKSMEAAVMMCDEAHYDSIVLDDASKLAGVDVVILPDTTVITTALRETLKSYYAQGGNLIVSYKSGHDAAGAWALDFLPLTHQGEVDLYPNYWRARADFAPELSVSDRVIYSKGLNVTGGDGARVLVDRVLPYFKRTDLKFSSHFQTPPQSNVDAFPAVIGGERFVYFADPIFREYRQTGNLAIRDGWRRAMELAIGLPPFGAGLPTTVQCVPRRQGDDLLLTLLHYVPTRKALEIDVIEERMSFAGLTLRLPAAAKIIQNAATGEALKRISDGAFELPMSSGRLLLRVPRFWQS
ncbi:MAG: alpha-L-fucosidase [Capsulimonadaceae bacterium]|nr:alpha-L-fucosidase [Capsulimonadaceae bacterium]